VAEFSPQGSAEGPGGYRKSRERPPHEQSRAEAGLGGADGEEATGEVEVLRVRIADDVEGTQSSRMCGLRAVFHEAAAEAAPLHGWVDE